MFNQLKEAFKSFAEVFSNLPTGKKLAIGAVGVFTLVGILLTAYLSSGEEYTVLYSNLSQEDTLAITEKLNDRKIKFKLERAGTVVSVFGVDVYQLRLEFAGEGLPSGGGVGFELFDQSTFGMTEFVQNLNYRRALQGELQRTINSMGPVKTSRVHIVIPRRNLFDDDAAKATASITLELKGGRRLSQEQIDSVGHLVSSSVEGLDVNRITIIDTKGNLLSVPEEDDQVHRLSVKQLEYRRIFESGMEKRIQTMIERAVGLGKAVVRVSAKMDFKQVQRTEEIYDPASQVSRSEQRLEENTTGAALPAGIAGVESNLPGITKNDAAFSKPASSNKTNETINYEINKTVQTVIEPTSVVKKLSVAVLVDGKYKDTEGAEGQTTREFSPISDDEKSRLENLVRSAIGFDPERQDVVTIESMQFDLSRSLEGVGEPKAMLESDVKTIIEYAGVAIMGLGLLLFLMRPLMGWVSQSTAEVNELKSFPKTLKDMEAELGKLTEVVEGKVDAREKVSEIVATNPEAAANLVRSWLRSRG